MQTNNAHEYTDEQIIDAAKNAFDPDGDMRRGFFEGEHSFSIVKAFRDFLAALPKAAPWTLPAPPPGRRWHREDWKPEWLEGGYRPLLNGEACEKGDEVHLPLQKRWSDNGLDFGAHMTSRHLHTRTRRPLPAEASAEPEQVKPATFEAYGKTWTRHTPGDPCPCDPNESVDTLLEDREIGGTNTKAKRSNWGIRDTGDSIIGWRYADEPAQPTQSQQAWTPRPGDVVRLKSGGPEMTVESVTGFGIAFCSWMTAVGSLETRPVAVVMLTQAKEGQP